MTEHDTTDHVAAINDALEDIYMWTDDQALVSSRVDTIRQHADALAARLAAAERDLEFCREIDAEDDAEYDRVCDARDKCINDLAIARERLAAAEARADRWRDAFLTFWGDNTGPGDDIPDLGHLGLEASDWPNTDGGDES